MDSSAAQELAERVARLEAQVALLLEQRPPSVPPVQVVPPPIQGPVLRAATVPRAPAPRTEVSPVVWIAGLGAALFLAGAVFFFRWAVQQGWVGAELRFALGLLAGAGISIFAARRLILGDDRRLGVALLLAGLGTLEFTFRVGAIDYQFYAPAVGLLAAAVITLLAGALAARSGSSGALTVALITGLAAPLAFSQGDHHEVALVVYLGVLMAAALAVPYVTRRGATWTSGRWTALMGVWLLLVTSSSAVAPSDAHVLGALLLLHLILAGLWAWVPGLGEIPATPSALWIVASVLATSSGWLVWKRAGLVPEMFALPVLAVAVLNLALVQPLRRRMAGRQADWGLLALAVGHLALAVPVVLDWRWTGPLWGLFAVSLAWASLGAEGNSFQVEAWALRSLAAGLASIASLRWAFHAFDGYLFVSSQTLPWLNTRFAEGALASVAWFLLAGGGGSLGQLSFVALEITANGTLAFELARLVQWFETPIELVHGPSRTASIVMTLVWAFSGAWQWMRGLGQTDAARHAQMLAGYAWMGVAGYKLIMVDLARADTPLRALAFLGVGAIGMAAAILANRRRPQVAERP